MFHRILVAIDDSQPARRAVTAASRLAQAEGSEVELLHIHPWAMVAAPSPAGLGPMPRAEAEEVADPIGSDERALVDEAVRDLTAEGVHAEGSVVGTAEPVAQALTEVARHHHADLIVIGSRGRSQLSGLLLGSTAYQTIHLAACPVLVVP